MENEANSQMNEEGCENMLSCFIKASLSEKACQSRVRFEYTDGLAVLDCYKADIWIS